jgi:hypothetical protein
MGREGAIGARRISLLIHLSVAGHARGRVAVGAAARIDWALKQSARVLPAPPKAKVDVREAAPLTQDSASSAFYKAAALDGSRPAIFNVNLRSTLDFPTWSLPTLAFHEAVPGHHMQAGLARERTQATLSYFISVPAFSEGWATYAEDLAAERRLRRPDRAAGLSSGYDPERRGWWRTPASMPKWTRPQASPTSDTIGISGPMECRMTIWRGWPAATWPGGRLSGRHAERRKAAFDLKAFHEAIAFPAATLPVLEADIAAGDESLSRPPNDLGYVCNPT